MDEDQTLLTQLKKKTQYIVIIESFIVCNRSFFSCNGDLRRRKANLKLNSIYFTLTASYKHSLQIWRRHKILYNDVAPTLQRRSALPWRRRTFQFLRRLHFLRLWGDAVSFATTKLVFFNFCFSLQLYKLRLHRLQWSPNRNPGDDPFFPIGVWSSTDLRLLRIPHLLTEFRISDQLQIAENTRNRETRAVFWNLEEEDDIFSSRWMKENTKRKRKE